MYGKNIIIRLTKEDVRKLDRIIEVLDHRSGIKIGKHIKYIELIRAMIDEAYEQVVNNGSKRY